MEQIKSGAARLKTWRYRRELRQIDAALLIGMHPSAYNRIERGHQIPGPRRAKQIAAATNGAVPSTAWAAKP